MEIHLNIYFICGKGCCKHFLLAEVSRFKTDYKKFKRKYRDNSCREPKRGFMDNSLPVFLMVLFTKSDYCNFIRVTLRGNLLLDFMYDVSKILSQILQQGSPGMW